MSQTKNKVTVVLYEEQVLGLDRLCFEAKMKNRKAQVGRSDLIRAAITMMLDSGIDISNATSEEDVLQALSDRWQANRAEAE